MSRLVLARLRVKAGAPLLAVLLSAAAVLVAGAGHAQPGASDRATAATLSDDARKLMARSRYEEACPKLAESLRLASSLVTQLSLAQCYEHVGKMASAWRLYDQAAGEATRTHDSRQEKAARTKMQALEPRLPNCPRSLGLTSSARTKSVATPATAISAITARPLRSGALPCLPSAALARS